MDAWLKENILFVAPIASILIFVAGFLTSRFTMTKKERRDFEQRQFENGKELAETQLQRFQGPPSTLWMRGANFRKCPPIISCSLSYFLQNISTDLMKLALHSRNCSCSLLFCVRNRSFSIISLFTSAAKQSGHRPSVATAASLS